MIAVGIDPGLTGAVAFVDSRGTHVIEEMPTLALPGNPYVKRRVDGRKLADVLRAHCPVGEPVRVLVEAVHTIGSGGRAGNALQTQGSLLRTLGAIEAVLEVLRLDFESVDVRRWKGFYALGADKDESLDVARRLYPSASLKRKADHNKAEALLIAHFGLRSGLA